MKIQKYIFLFFVSAQLLTANSVRARTIPAPFIRTASGNFQNGDPVTMFVLYGGILAGGKQNTCYLLKSRFIIQDKVTLDGSLYHHFNGDDLYSANIGLGGILQLSVGLEWGDRRYVVNKDSTLEHIKFKNLSTGEYEPYSSFSGFSTPQKVTSINVGFGFQARMVKTNFWRGQGNSFTLINFKFEMMFAPKVEFDPTVDIIVQGPYQEETSTYELEGAKVRKFGFRMMFDSRMSSKIGWMMEVGMRPGVSSEINEEHRFSNGYLRMGVLIGISVGGRKALR